MFLGKKIWSYSTWKGEEKKKIQTPSWHKWTKMKLSCLNSRKSNLCQKLSDWSYTSLKQGYQSLPRACLQHDFSYLQLAVLQQWSHVSWNSLFLFPYLLFFRIVFANPGKILFCLYNWAIRKSWAGMDAAVLSEHSHGLTGFDSYLCRGHWKSILLCLTFLPL